jgi:hypothetical protein
MVEAMPHRGAIARELAMRASFVFVCVAFAAATGSAAGDEARSTPAMKFSWIPMVERSGPGDRKIFSYRLEDRIVVLVQDPIVCGQKPINQAFELQGNKLFLRYELTNASPKASDPPCTAHSIFAIDGVPNQDLEISFARGEQAFAAADMARCPEFQPTIETRNCLAPRK